MKLWSIIGASLAAALALAAGAGEMALVDTRLNPALEQALGFALAAAGGPGGLCLILFAVLSALLIAESAVVDLGRVRGRLPQGAVRRVPEAWQEALAGTTLGGLAASIAGEDLAIPPFALTRVVRAEVWRIVARRLVTAQTVTVALAALALVLAPQLPATPSVATAAALRIDVFAAAALFAAAVTGWLLIERAIDGLALVLTQRLAAAEASARPAGPSAPWPAGADPAPMPVEPLAAAVHRLTGLIERLGERESALGTALAQSAATQDENFSAALERAGERDERMLEPVGAALTELATALERLAETDAEHTKRVGAMDRHLLAVLRRQEEIVESLSQRWSELVRALEALSASERANGGLPAVVSTAQGAGEAGEELQELLELLDEEQPEPDAPARERGRLRG